MIEYFVKKVTIDLKTILSIKKKSVNLRTMDEVKIVTDENKVEDKNLVKSK